MKAVLGDDFAKQFGGVGASMQATELGALAQVAELLISRGDGAGKRGSSVEVGFALVELLAHRVRTEVLLVEAKPEVKP